VAGLLPRSVDIDTKDRRRTISTNDVPGNKPENRDQLATGSWAEHDDGSLIFVKSTEGGRVIYEIFDLSKTPVIQYTDAMKTGAFMKQFSWSPADGKTKDKWTWHDKTVFPWDKVIKAGAADGTSFAHADDQITAAERVRQSREIHRGSEVDPVEVETRLDKLGDKANKILRKIQKAISELPGR
jgi:hypothetical protein